MNEEYQFLRVNLLQDESEPTTNHSEVIEEPTITKRIKLTQEELRQDEELIKMLVTATYQVANDSGWSNLGTVGQYLMNNNSFSSYLAPKLFPIGIYKMFTFFKEAESCSLLNWLAKRL